MSTFTLRYTTKAMPDILVIEFDHAKADWAEVANAVRARLFPGARIRTEMDEAIDNARKRKTA